MGVYSERVIMAGAEPPGCVFIPLGTDTSETGPGDTRRFRVGEPVCMRGEYNPRMGVYVHPLPRPGGQVFLHAIRSPEYPNDRHVHFEDIGKIVPTLGPQLSVEQVGRAFPKIPPTSVYEIGRFVGARDPGQFPRDTYANRPAPGGVSARRPETSELMSLPRFGGRRRKSRRSTRTHRVRKTRRRHK